VAGPTLLLHRHQLTRLGGPNTHEIPINRVLCPVDNNQRDGHMRQTIVKGRVSYEPNSLGGGCPMQKPWEQGGFVSYPGRIEGEKIRVRSATFSDHFSQPGLFWRSQSKPRWCFKCGDTPLGKPTSLYFNCSKTSELYRYLHF
jgi:catalase